MERLLLLIFMTIQFLGCSDKSKKDKSVLEEVQTDTSKFIYADSDKSSFKILAGDTNNGYDFKSIEKNYKIVFIAPFESSDLKHYFAKYTTTTKSCTGCEGQERTIKVELCAFDKPQKTEFTIQQNCDELTLDMQTYKTTKFGCCGDDDLLAIYDYNNKLIIEGDSKILLGEIPNSSIKLFVSFKPEYNDTTFLGTLYYCYNSSDRYAIKVKSNPLPSDSCSPFSPDIFIYSTNPHDKFVKENNEYSFWSLNKIENKNQINNLSLKIAFECDSALRLDTINIPIINGKPFGNENRNQEFVFMRK